MLFAQVSTFGSALRRKIMKAVHLCLVVSLLAISIGSKTLANETLAQESGCLGCHGLDSKNIGPAFKDIAAKYNNSGLLVKLVKNGGKGNWAESHDVPMPPYSPRLSDTEINQLVNWILTL
jgi:cytochrome c